MMPTIEFKQIDSHTQLKICPLNESVRHLLLC